MKRTIVLIPLAELVEHPSQAAIYGKTTVDADFINSVREHGQLTPGLVTAPDPETKIRRVISGHSRVLALRQVGIETFACEVKAYESLAEEEVDLIHSNKGRLKTQAQINKEVQRLRGALSDLAKGRQASGLKKGVKEGKSPLGENSPGGRANDQIADALGMSADEVKARTALHDDEYRTKFIDRMRAAGARDQLVDECTTEWNAIREQQEAGELKVFGAETLLKKLQRKMMESCPANKNAKKGKPEAKPKRERKPSLRIVDQWDGNVMIEVDECDYPNVGVVKFGYVDGQAHIPMISLGGVTYVVNWPAVIEYIKESTT